MNPNDFLDKLSEEEQAKKLEQDKADQIGAVNQSGDKVVEALKGHTNELTGSIHDLLMATLVSKDPKIAETAKNLAGLLGEIKNATQDIKGANFKPLADNLSQLQKTLTTVPKQIEAAHQSTDPNPLLKEIATTLGKKNFNPNVNVKAPKVDLSPLTKILTDIKTAVSTENEPDNSKLEDLTQSVASAVGEVKDAITSLRFPVPNYVLPFQSSDGKDAQVILGSDGSVPVAATFSGTLNSSPTFKDDPTASGETPKYGKTNSVTHKQEVEADVTGTVTANAGTGTFAVSAASLPLPTGAATNAILTGGTQLSQIVDAGGEVATVTGGKLDVNATISGTGGGTSSIDNSAFVAGSDSGTPIMGFYHSTIDTVTDGRTATLAMDSKRNLFGVIRDAAGNARGANVNSSNQLSVTVDNTPSVNATLAAETTKVIGTVRNADGAGNLWTSNSTTYTAKFAQDANLLGTLGTAFSTAGKVDVKGADGDVFVRQATASNLNATVVGTGTFATQATLQTGTNQIGHLEANQSVNVAQVNGVTPLMGAGNTGTGSPRVTIASDQVAIPVTTSPTAPTTIYNGKKTVTTAGTRVTLASSQAVKSVVIKALAANTGIIYVGDTSVASTNGFALAAGEIVSLDIANLSTVNIDSSVNGEGVTYVGTN